MSNLNSGSRQSTRNRKPPERTGTFVQLVDSDDEENDTIMNGDDDVDANESGEECEWDVTSNENSQSNRHKSNRHKRTRTSSKKNQRPNKNRKLITSLAVLSPTPTSTSSSSSSSNEDQQKHEVLSFSLESVKKILHFAWRRIELAKALPVTNQKCMDHLDCTIDELIDNATEEDGKEMWTPRALDILAHFLIENVFCY